MPKHFWLWRAGLQVVPLRLDLGGNCEFLEKASRRSKQIKAHCFTQSIAPMDKPPASASTTTTTFIHADTTTFKELVQRLTGSPESTTTASAACSPPSSSSSSLPAGRHKRLHHGSHLRLAIPKPVAPSGSTKPASPAAPSPAASFARLDISAEEKSGEAIEEEEEEEERAIKERRFYLYPSPRAKNRVAEPELLPLFPLTSQRAAAGEP